jgi:hypothetical protein
MDRAYYAALVGLASAALAGCAPKIGSKCVLNTDCGTSGALVCDTSQPNGYCTQFNCTPNSCQNQAVCVEFLPMVPGCTYDDYHSPSRSSRDFCMEHCNHDSDCRQSDGYVCEDPRKPPWNAAITDDNQSQLVCILPPDTPIPGVNVSLVDGSLPLGSVCSPSGPFVPPLDAGVEVADGASEGGPDSSSAEAGEGGEGRAFEGGADTGPDAGADAGVDAGQGGAFEDGGTDEGAGDTGGDGAADAGGPDAPGGG